MNTKQRQEDIQHFYKLLVQVKAKIGTRYLRDCDGRMDWPLRGVYFFLEEGEIRTSGKGLRVVRVGTHAITINSKTKLWNRLSQHRGNAKSHGGNHRGSIFRLIVGTAIIDREDINCETWGVGNNAAREIREAEIGLERLVSHYIGDMPFIWLNVDDAPGPGSLRGYIERNSIALLSNSNRQAIDPCSESWLGLSSNRELVRSSHLWNQRHTDEEYDPDFLLELEHQISNMESSGR